MRDIVLIRLKVPGLENKYASFLRTNHEPYIGAKWEFDNNHFIDEIISTDTEKNIFTTKIGFTFQWEYITNVRDIKKGDEVIRTKGECNKQKLGVKSIVEGVVDKPGGGITLELKGYEGTYLRDKYSIVDKGVFGETKLSDLRKRNKRNKRNKSRKPGDVKLVKDNEAEEQIVVVPRNKIKLI